MICHKEIRRPYRERWSMAGPLLTSQVRTSLRAIGGFPYAGRPTLVEPIGELGERTEWKASGKRAVEGDGVGPGARFLEEDDERAFHGSAGR
jgi:hypothetical protein